MLPKFYVSQHDMYEPERVNGPFDTLEAAKAFVKTQRRADYMTIVKVENNVIEDYLNYDGYSKTYSEVKHGPG